MKKLNNVFLYCFFLVGAGCTFDSDVSDSDRNKIVTCTDTRDGEVFQFNTNSMRSNVTFIGTTRTTIITLDGKKMTLTKSMLETWLKCKKRPAP